MRQPFLDSRLQSRPSTASYRSSAVRPTHGVFLSRDQYLVGPYVHHREFGGTAGSLRQYDTVGFGFGSTPRSNTTDVLPFAGRASAAFLTPGPAEYSRLLNTDRILMTTMQTPLDGRMTPRHTSRDAHPTRSFVSSSASLRTTLKGLQSPRPSRPATPSPSFTRPWTPRAWPNLQSSGISSASGSSYGRY